MWWQRRAQRDFQSEIESHLQLEIDRLVDEGVPADEARSRALQAFGNVTSARERFYESRRMLWADQLVRDIRYTLRVLSKSPGVALLAIVTMALGIGATTSIFTVVNAVLLKPLSYPEPDRLVACLQRHAQHGPEVVTLPDYLDWRDRSKSFESLSAAWSRIYNLTGTAEPERLPGGAVTANLFRTMATPPQVGRVITSDQERDVVVLSHRLWQRSFGGRSEVLGQSITLNGKPHSVIGVMPPSFTYPAEAELWVPFISEPSMNRGYHQFWVVGRLKDGSTIDTARAELETIAAQSERDYPGTNKNWGVLVTTLQEHIVGQSRRPVLTLAGAVGCLLLLACANVAALLISKSASRSHEMSVRSALGASRGQIIRQLLTESVLLSLAGGAAGLLAATWSIEPLLRLTTLPRTDEISLNMPVLLFALVVSVGAGILFGLAPAAAATESQWNRGLNLRGGISAGRLRPVLAGVQIAIAAVLLCGAGLLMRSFQRLYQVEPGFNAQAVLTVRFFLPRASYPVEKCVQLYRNMTERMMQLPGVESAAAVSSVPFSGVNANVVFEMPGRQRTSADEQLTAEFRAATPGYFRTLGIPLLSGRDFDGDTAESPFVAVVNRAFVNRFLGGREPIGHFVRILGPKPRMIVGVIRDIRHRGLDAPVEPEIYVPHTQFPTGGMFLTMRTRFRDPMVLANTVRAELRALDPDLPIARIQSWEQLLGQTLATRRFSLILLTVFSVVALVLAVTGIYGMLASSVSQRTKEIGVRMALGASPSAVVKQALREGMLPAVLGLAGGLLAAVGTSRLLQGLLFEVHPSDPLTATTVGGVLLCAALAACVGPVRRAARVDPMVALRHE